MPINSKSNIRRLMITTLILSLGSCATVSNDGTATLSNANLPKVPDNWQTLTISDQLKVPFLESFNDPLLNSLVKEAFEKNKNLIASSASIDKSRALAVQAGANLKPMANLSFGDNRTGGFESSSSTTTSRSVGVQVQWELDLWGRVRSGAQAAYSSLQAVERDHLFARHSIAANVAKTYFLALEAQLQEKVGIATLDNLSKTARIVNLQYENGLASSQDVSLIQSDLASVQEQLESIKASKRKALRALEVLLGRYPSADLEVAKTLPKLPPMSEIGLPSELLERRPDIAAAERRVAAAFNALEQTKAAQLPSLTLSSNIGGSSNDLSDLLKPENLAWQLASNLLVPLFDSGLRQAQVDAASADQKQAIAAYGQAALDAFAEVENQLDTGAELHARKFYLDKVLAEAQKALRIATLKHNAGETDLLDVLSIQTRVTSAESSLVSIQRNLLDQRVDLHLATGGEW
jgi:NodT family efflux transporter outer membrane factor (OMF) lipoprotein